MNRKDREVTDLNAILAILDTIDTLHIAMRGDEYPYSVPVSFGYTVADGRLVLYVHGAKRGMKLDLLRRDPRVCVSGERFIRYEETAGGITTRYESVIGFGRYESVEDRNEKVLGLKLLCAHCGRKDYDVSACGALDHTDVFRIVLESVTGKSNPGERQN